MSFNNPGEGFITPAMQVSNTDGPLTGRKDDPVTPQTAVSHYFAAAPSNEIAAELQAKVDLYYTYIGSANLAELWRRSYRAYYGMRQNTGVNGWGVFDSAGMVGAGDQGEIIRVKVNQFANLMTHQLALTASNRPAVQCRSSNSDASGIAAATLGNGVWEYLFRTRRMERNYYRAVETGLILSEGFTALGWDATGGKEFGRGPNNSIIYDGNITATNFTPFQVIKDVTVNSYESSRWFITHGKRNKFDLAEKYAKDNPYLYNQILNVSSDETTSENRTFADPSRIIAATSFGVQESDDIPYMEFYHKKCAALPEGRYTIFINGDIMLFDGPLPFRDIPIYRICPKEVINTPFGWTTAFDILALQELLDKLYTVVSSNVLGSGVQNFWCPPNNGVDVSQLGGNRALIESVVKPEVLPLLQTAPEVYAYINKVEQVMQTLAGVSAVNRGDMPSKDMSGSAMALLAAQATIFNSSFQESCVEFLEHMSTGALNIENDYAQTPRVASIVGKQNTPILLSYKGSDLDLVEGTYCDASNALSKTTAGKMTLAQDLLKAGMVQTPQEYITLVETGQMEPMTRAFSMENNYIQQENEDMLAGKDPVVLRFDRHDQHIQEHKTILFTPMARGDAGLIERVDKHIRWHEDMKLQMQIMDPMYLQVNGEAPSPFPQQPAPQPPQPGVPGPEAAQMANPQSPVAQRAKKVKQPNLPNLPKGADPQAQEGYAKLQQSQGM